MRSVGSKISQLPPTGAGTKWLCIAIVVVSVLGSVSQRNAGRGVLDLNYQIGALFELELWRLVTYPFAVSQPLGLLISVLVLWLLGRWFESEWGTRDFVRFFFVSSVGAGILAVPFFFVLNQLGLFRDMGMAEGPGAAIDAMLVAIALMAPESKILFGFVLPIRAKNIVLILVGFEVLSGLMSGASRLSITLGGLLMGYLLVTGNWRPQRFVEQMRLHWARHRRRRRGGLYVVSPRGRKKRTLH